MSTNDCICCEIRGRLDRVGEIKGAVQLPTCDGLMPTLGEFTENGTYTAPKGYAYNPVVVDVEAFEPTGSVELTENGVYDVTEYAEAEVNVPQPSGNIEITENGSYDISDYATANVDVAGLVPSGTLNISANGDYDVTEYAEASVSVPNTYTASDEGKVVNGGALVGQTSKTVTENGTIDTTLNDEVVINVPNPSSGTLNITENGVYDVTEKASVDVNVAGAIPSGTLNITANGQYDVTDKANADVNVKQWDAELKAILDGSATSLTGLPSGLSKIRPYAFYRPSRNLPSEYVRLDSVHFGGNSAIYTDIPNTAQALLNIEAQSDGSRSVSQVLYGFDRGANGGSYFGVMPNGTVWSLGGTLNFSTAFVRTLAQITNTASPMSITATVNGVAHSRTGTASTQTNIMIGGVLDNSNRVTYPFVGTVYGEITAFVRGVLQYDYIPVKRLADNKIGYYDSVNNVFKLPTGSDLTGGAEIPSVETNSIETADLDVTEIGAYAFYNNELSSLTLRANQVVTLGESALDGTPIADGTGTVYVPSDLVSAYEADSNWSSYDIQAIA